MPEGVGLGDAEVVAGQEAHAPAAVEQILEVSFEELGSDDPAEELVRDFEGRIPHALRPDTEEEVGLEFEP